MSPGRFLAERLARPLDLELWIGLPDHLNSRVAPMIPTPPPAPGDPPDHFTARLIDPSSLLHRAFVNPMLPPTVFNEPAFRAAEVPAANGIGTARALSRL